MKVQALRTPKIVPGTRDIFSVLDESLHELPEGSVLAVTSKVVSLCEGRVVPVEGTDKAELVRREAEWYIPAEENSYGVFLTIARSHLIPTAGIDESNAKGVYVLWPRNPQKTANEIRSYLEKRFARKKAGVLITDSTSRPLRWGVGGVAIAHSGFLALRDYRGKPDLFGRPLRVTQVNVADALAASAVFEMGEGAEQTPLAVIEDIPSVEFQNRSPNPEELAQLRISVAEDLYGSILRRAPWKQGEGS